jgi:hypothetical protein
MLGVAHVAHERQLDIIGHSTYHEARGSSSLVMQKGNAGEGLAKGAEGAAVSVLPPGPRRGKDR